MIFQFPPSKDPSQWRSNSQIRNSTRKALEKGARHSATRSIPRSSALQETQSCGRSSSNLGAPNSVADARRGHPRAPLELCRVVMSTRSKRAHRRSRSSSESLSDEPPAKIYASSAAAAAGLVDRLARLERATLAWQKLDERLSPGARTGIFNLSELSSSNGTIRGLPPLVRPAAKRPPSSSGLSTISWTESLGVQTRSVCTPPRTRASGLDTPDDISSVVEFAPRR